MPLLLSMLASVAMTAPATPGKLFAVGGSTTPPEVAQAFFAACGGKSAPVLVLAQTRENPETGGQSSADFLKEQGGTSVTYFGLAKPTDSDKADLEKRIDGVKGIWIPGGVQGRFLEVFGTDWSRRVFQAAYRRGVNFFGTSAGAMLMSDSMIYGPGPDPDTAETGPGLGLTDWVIDTHFAQRKREGRLRHALSVTGRSKGFGLDEREWIVIQDNVILERHRPKPEPR